MIYHLFNYLKDFNFPGHNLMTYLSFRAILAVVISMLIAFFAGGSIIKRLRRAQIGEDIRDLGLEGQMQKKGTPTMGGVIIILSMTVSALLVCDLTNIYVQLLLLTTLWCGGIGFADDYIKVFKHRKEGMSAKTKLILQFALAVIIAAIFCFSPSIWGEGPKQLLTTIPFAKGNEFDYSWLSPFKGVWGWYAKWAIYVLMIVVVITACSNGTNLTDGLDGLAAGTSAIVGVVIGILAWLGGNLIDSNYLNILYMPGTGEIAIFMSAFVGALIGFLWYNSYPAQVFMGDTGSLTIGGIIAVSAIIMHKELLLPLLCGVFLFEILSDLDVKLFVKRGKKHRIWKTAPLHDHFRMSYGKFKEKWPNSTVTFKGRGEGYNTVHHEVKITIRFWIVTILLAAFTLITFKIR